MTESVSERPTREDVPRPAVKTKRQFSIVWLIPLVAALIGAWLAYKTLSEKGPTITITFETAEGLEAGKTKIKYKDVEIGQVESISLSKDLSHVILTANLVKQAEQYLSENTRFWVVRARVTASQISGIGTIFSGAYIGIDPGKPGKAARAFKGLETPPILMTGVAGKTFVLQADKLGSIDVGVPVYFRQIKVGQVVAYELNKDGQAVTIKVFVNAPYDGLVRENTRFWNAGGIDVSFDAGGVKVNTESLMSIVLGGVAFETPVSLEPGEVAQEGYLFTLYDSREKSYQKTYLVKRYFILYFNDSVRGLSRGAPVEFRGIKVGQVLDVTLEFNREKLQFRIPVLIEFEPERLTLTGGTPNPQERLVDKLVERGLRAQLKTGSLLTGQLYVDLDVHPEAPARRVVYAGKYPEIPTIPAPLEAVTEKLTKFVDRLEKLPLEQTTAELRQGLQNLRDAIKQSQELVRHVDTDITPQTKATLEQVERTLASIERLTSSDAPLHQDLQRAIQELAETARSMRILTDYLQQHPDSILYGKGNNP